jgi:hypothetical protein
VSALEALVSKGVDADVVTLTEALMTELVKLALLQKLTVGAAQKPL